jgi:hypothetical protein
LSLRKSFEPLSGCANCEYGDFSILMRVVFNCAQLKVVT